MDPLLLHGAVPQARFVGSNRFVCFRLDQVRT